MVQNLVVYELTASITSKTRGTVLVFLPGMPEILRMSEMLNHLYSVLKLVHTTSHLHTDSYLSLASRTLQCFICIQPLVKITSDSSS